METYNFKSWNSINLDISDYLTSNNGAYFLILDHEYIGNSSPDEDDNILYSGFTPNGLITSLNDILVQYINPTPIIFTSSLQPDNASHSSFYIYYTQNDWSTWLNDIIIITYDWSYDNIARSVLSDPIINLVDNRQFFVYTIKTATPDIQTTITMKIDDIIVTSFQISGYTYYNLVQDLSLSTYPGEFSYAYSYDFFVDRTVPIDGVNKITIGPSTYYVTNTCYKYCLYYLNQYGGWDSLLFRGRELKTDDLSRLSYKKNYIAGSLEFNKVDYLTTIQERWSLNTSFLNNIESSKMINLMASNKLYIHDLENGYIAPVNITNSNCEHKNYKNQGRKMATYNIEVSSSQPKYRI